jgi:LuxR family transcriptional regulator, maltose regulon positive regulatory protein
MSNRRWWDDHVTIPKPIRHELGRPALLHRLMDAPDIPLALILAPSGYGKTTLLAQLARHLPTPVAWLTLRDDCANPVTLTEGLIAALETLPPTVGTFTVSRTFQGFGDWRALTQALNTANQPITLVLDGIDHLSAESGALIVQLLNHLGAGHRLILAGYAAQHLKLYRHLSAGAALMLGPDDLAFTVNETRSLLQVRNVKLDPVATQRHVSGWPVAVGLLASGNLHGFTPEGLLEEILELLSPELRRCLPLAGIASTWSDDDLNALGIELPFGWLEQVRFAGLPVTPLGAHRFRPHDLLRRVLSKRLEVSPEQVVAIRRRAAQIALERGDVIEASQFYHQLGDSQAALRVVEELLESSWARAEFSSVRRLLEPFEMDRLELRYAAMLAVSWLETGRAEDGNALLDRLSPNGAARSIVLYGQVRRSMRQGDVAAQLALSAQALEGDLGAAERARFERLRANALHNLDDFQGAVDICQRLVLEAERDGRLTDLGNALFVMQASLFNLQRWSDCETALLRGIQVFEQLDLTVRLVPLLVDLAELYRVTGRTRQAADVLDRVQPLAEREESELLPVIVESRGDLALMNGQLETAQSRFQSALEHCEAYQYKRVAARIRLRLSEVLARRGAMTEALTMFRAAQQTPSVRPEWLGVAEAYHRGVIAWHTGDLETARTAFERVHGASSDPFHSPRATAWLCVLAHRDQRLTAEAVDALRERCRNFHWAQVSAPDQAVFEPMMLEARRRGWWFEPRQEKTVAFEQRPTTLTITTLGRLELHVNDIPVRIPLTKSFEILAFLALEGPSRRETIVDALWDGSSDTRHIDYFKVALRRLRVAVSEVLGSDVNAVPVTDKRFGIDAKLSVNLDAHALNRATHTHDLGALRQTLECYRGDFLPFSESTWALQRRQSFLLDAVSLAIRIGDRLAQNQDPECLTFLRRAVQLDPLHVTAHHRLIQHLLTFGHPHQALRVWQDLNTLCREELLERPDPHLEVLIRQRLEHSSSEA